MVARGAGEPTAKRAKADEAKEEEDPLVRRREELVRLLGRARKGKEVNKRAKEELVTLCARLEAKNGKLLTRLPPELWQKILDENLQQNDLLALAMTCRFFREKQKDLEKKAKTIFIDGHLLWQWQWQKSGKMETNLGEKHLVSLRKGGKVTSHTLGWFRWVCDTLKVLPGFLPPEWRLRGPGEDFWSARVKGAVYEGNLVNYAAFQGSVEILRWLMEEKGCKLNKNTGEWAGVGGSVKVLEHLRGRGYKFDEMACSGAAEGGHLEALKFLRGLDPPCPWNEWTCCWAAEGGYLDILKFLRAQDPPCPWGVGSCAWAARRGHLDVLKWLRSQDPPCPWDCTTCTYAARGGHLEVLKWSRSQDPPCPWSRRACKYTASMRDHEHIVDWIDQQGGESGDEDIDFSDIDIDISFDSYGDLRR